MLKSGDRDSLPPGLTLSEVIITPSSYISPEGEKLTFPPLPSLPQNVTSDKSSTKKIKEKEKETVKKEEVDDWGTKIDHLWGDSDGKEEYDIDDENTPWGDIPMKEDNEDGTKNKWIYISGAGDYDDIDSQVNFNDMLESFKGD
jgi:hypothetical protein